MMLEVHGKVGFEIVEEIGEQCLTNTQKYRVLIVKDLATQQHKISAQRWWRKSVDEEWQVGKGFQLDKEKALNIAQMIIQGAESL